MTIIYKTHIEAWQKCVKDDRILVVERTHADDFDGLMYAAQSALHQALDDGESKGFEPGDWLKQSAESHLQHARDHVAAIKTFPEFSREDVSHAICRLLMLWARVEPPPVCFELALGLGPPTALALWRFQNPIAYLQWWQRQGAMVSNCIVCHRRVESTPYHSVSTVT